MKVCNDKMRKFLNRSSATVGAYLHCWELELTGKFEKCAVSSLQQNLRVWKADNVHHAATLEKKLTKYFRDNEAYFYLMQDCSSWKDGIKQYRVSSAEAVPSMVPMNFELIRKMFERNDLWPNERTRDSNHTAFCQTFEAELNNARVEGKSAKLIVEDEHDCKDPYYMPEDLKEKVEVAIGTGRSVSKSRAFAEHYGNNQPIGFIPDDLGPISDDILGKSLVNLEQRILKSFPHHMEIEVNFSKENEMSNTRKLVRIAIIDNDAGLKVEHSMVHTSDAFVTEDDNQTTIMQYMSEQPMNEILLKHNNVRESQVDEVILRNTGNTVMLRPVKLKDLSIEVRPV